MEERFKLGATICYDKEREQDIINQLDKLKSQHKLGDLITNLIRIAFEHPKELRELGLRVENYGLSDNRREFFNGIEKKILEMSKKVNGIYDMAVKMYSLALFNKKIGLEQKSINLLQAQFILQKQINELCTILGVSNLGHTFESNKLYNVAKNVDEILEFIINYYDGIVDEIKQNMVIKNEVASTTVSNQMIVKDEIKNDAYVNTNSDTENVQSNNVNNDTVTNIPADEPVDEIVDFGMGVDLSILDNFLGGM